MSHPPRKPPRSRRFGLVLVAVSVAAALALSSCDSSRRAATPEEGAVLPDDTGPKLEAGSALTVLLPKVKRSSDVRWGQATKLPGHLAAPLITRKGKKVMLLVTVDDLLLWPERVAILGAMSHSIAGMPADVAEGSWIRVLVANRFEVSVRARADKYRDGEMLRTWFDRLKLDKLVALAAPKAPEAAK